MIQRSGESAQTSGGFQSKSNSPALPLRVLVACEFSAIVRDAFLEKGHDAWSCDPLPAEHNSNRHIQCDVRDILNDGWDFLIVAHPPCTRLCNSGVRWLHKAPCRQDPRSDVERTPRRRRTVLRHVECVDTSHLRRKSGHAFSREEAHTELQRVLAECAALAIRPS